MVPGGTCGRGSSRGVRPRVGQQLGQELAWAGVSPLSGPPTPVELAWARVSHRRWPATRGAARRQPPTPVGRRPGGTCVGAGFAPALAAGPGGACAGACFDPASAVNPCGPRVGACFAPASAVNPCGPRVGACFAAPSAGDPADPAWPPAWCGSPVPAAWSRRWGQRRIGDPRGRVEEVRSGDQEHVVAGTRQHHGARAGARFRDAPGRWWCPLTAGMRRTDPRSLEPATDPSAAQPTPTPPRDALPGGARA